MINERYAHKYCRDDITKIENYELAMADTSHTWVIHHRLELTLDGEYAHSKEELNRMNMYYNRPYFELVFLTKSEHRRLHNMNMSDEHRRKISNSRKGMTFSDDHRRKLSEANKGKSLTDEARRKLSEVRKGRHWRIINGKRCWYTD